MLSKKLTLLSIILLACFFSACKKETPISPNEERGTLSFGFSLRPASQLGLTITRVNVTIARGSFVDSMDLAIAGDSAYGTFTGLAPGSYTIFVRVYDGSTLIATGSGEGTVIAGQTITVRITINISQGNLIIVVIWDTSRLTLSSSGKIFYNTGVFPGSFQIWHLGSSGTDRPWAQSNTVGNPAPSVTYTGSGSLASNQYAMGGIASNFIYQADVMFTNPSNAEGIYIIFRTIDTLSFYTAKYGPYYGGILVLSKNIGGTAYNILPPLYGLPRSANTWYNLEVRADGSSLQVYFDHTLRLSATDNSFASGLTVLGLGICCSGTNTWYVDNIKVFKSYWITVGNLQQGQRVELYDSTGSLRTSNVVASGQTSLELDASSLTFPFTGYFKVYSASGALLFTSQTSRDIWGGDVYTFR